MLEFEIWKASSMLFQPIPYNGVDTFNEDIDRNWDDNWHKINAKDIPLETCPNSSDCESYHADAPIIDLKTIGVFRDETNKITSFNQVISLN